MKYHNHEAVIAAGLDPSPRHADVVAWVENGANWRVSKRDDLDGPSALHHWPDGGWCNVRLVARGSVRLPNPEVSGPPPGGSTAPRSWTASSDSKQNPDGTYSDAESM